MKLLCLIAILFSIDALAQEQPSQEPEQRPQKQWGASLRLGGVAGSMSGGGIEAHKNVDEKNQVEGIYLVGGRDASKDLSYKAPVKVDKAQASVGMLEVQWRRFFTDTFNVTAGAGFQAAMYELKLSSTNSNDKVEQDIRVTRTIVSATVGNLWKFDNGFYIGGDWIGVALPLAYNYTVQTKTVGSVSTLIDQIQKDGEEMADKTGGQAALITLLLTAGMEF